MSDSANIFNASPEDRWLQMILSSRWNTQALVEARSLALTTPFRWPLIEEKVRQHSLSPLLSALTRGQDYLPASFVETLSNEYARNHTRNIIYFSELKRIIEILNAAQIPVIVLKGAALTLSIYRNLGVRPLVDIDLLVQRQHLSHALQVLSEIGFHPFGAEASRPGGNYENEILLSKKAMLVIFVELHWSLFNSPYYQRTLPLDWFWKGAIQIELEGAPLQILSPEPLLLHLCAHIFLHHSGQEILWLQDIAEVITEYNARLNWDALLKQARIYDLVLPVKHSLLRVSSEWGLAIPVSVLNAIQNMQPSPSEQKVYSSLTTRDPSVGQRFLDDLRYLPGLGSRLNYVWENLFPNPSYMRYRYHISYPLITLLYYPYRWFLGLRSIFR